MRQPGRNCRFALVLAVGAVGGAALTWSDARAQDEPARLAVTSKLPGWLAPGGQLVVRGTGTPGEAVTLSVGAAEQKQRVSRRGTFALHARAPAKAGSYVVALDTRTTAKLALGTVEVRPVRLAAVGDVNLGDRVGTAISLYGARYPWLSVAPVLRSADIALANLECAISRRGSPWPGKLYTFRGAPSSLQAMAGYAGVDVVSVANNHSLDYGRLAFADTLSYARDYGLKTVGGGRDLASARKPTRFRIGGIRIAILAYSDVRPLGFDATAASSGAAPAFPEYITADVERARNHAEVVIVYFHWGIERALTPSARQRSLARVAFAAGATVVLGAHPHVLQPIEQPRRHRLVAWSLGNFVFGANGEATARTGILRIRLDRRGVLRHRFRRARIGGVYGVQPILR